MRQMDTLFPEELSTQDYRRSISQVDRERALKNIALAKALLMTSKEQDQPKTRHLEAITACSKGKAYPSS